MALGIFLVMVLKNRSNEIRSNQIRIRRELPVIACLFTNFQFFAIKLTLHCSQLVKEIRVSKIENYDK